MHRVVFMLPDAFVLNGYFAFYGFDITTVNLDIYFNSS